ncbi:replicative DNA helicase [Deinococcus indicus]|uniref:replicative DNA helicase n=1 Tax=Deinococcus indicus TaxID=223556 RepID=UPI00174BD5EF|nr:replicative DNA helicase [Deinococcus indicus]GHG37875.1 replicative DNA helicase [Deinococcus indicus]
MSLHDAPTARVAPHNPQAETSVLGSVLLDSDLMRHPVVSILRTEDFYSTRHRLIWAAFQALHSEDKPADLITVVDHLTKRGQLDEAGGMVYLAGLSDTVPTSVYAEHYALIVKEHAHRRAMISHANTITRHAYDGDMPLEDLQHLAGTLPELEFGAGDGLVHLSDSLDEVMSEVENASGARGISTGLKDLDDMTNGLEPGRLYVLAARPGMGKSGLAFQIGISAALRGEHALGFSLEMPAREISARILASEARVGLDRLTRSRHEPGVLQPRDMDRLRSARDRLSGAPFTVLPKSGLRLQELIAQVHRAHERRPLSLFILDYIQLVQVNGRGGDNMTARVTEITNALKSLALELNIPVLALSQLSRAVEQRPNHRPQLSDLRESGSIEQDADVVMFIYRDEYYNPQTDQQGVAEIIVGKNRNGPAGMTKVQYQAPFVRFNDLAY